MLAKRFGWTPTEIDLQPAVVCDWLLAIGNMDDEVTADRQQKQREAR